MSEAVAPPQGGVTLLRRRPGILGAPEAPWPFTLPLWALLAAVLALPAVYSLAVSVLDASMFSSRVRFVGLTHFQTLLTDPAFLTSTLDTFVYTAGAVGLEMMLGLGMALLLNQHIGGFRVVRPLVIAPWVLSPVVAALLWRMMLQPNYGLVNYLLTLGGIPMGRLDWLGAPRLAMASIVIVDVWENTPFVYLILYAALQELPRELFEAANVDGANAWQRFHSVTWPLLWPATSVALTFRLIFAFREFAIPWTMTQGGPANATLLLSVYLYRHMFDYFDLGGAAAVGTVMTALTAFLVIPFLVRRPARAWR